MISKLKDALNFMANLRKSIVEAVMAVEKEFSGKTGDEKKALVVKKIDDMIKLPWVLDDLLDIDGKAISYLVDRVCLALNLLTGKRFDEVEADSGLVAFASKLPIDVLHAVTCDVPATEGDTQKTIDERLADLFARYGITSGSVTPDQDPVPSIPDELIDAPIEPELDAETESEKSEKWARCMKIIGIAEGGANFKFVGGKPVQKNNDKGGLTNFGVTETTLISAYAQGVVGHNDITKLTKAEAQTIFRVMYNDPYNWLDLPFEACLCLLDSTINHGPGGMAWIAQRTCNDLGWTPPLKLDSLYGPLTKAAIWALAKSGNTKEFCEVFLRFRKNKFDNIIKNRPSDEENRNGWYNRLRKLAAECGVKSPV